MPFKRSHPQHPKMRVRKAQKDKKNHKLPGPNRLTIFSGRRARYPVSSRHKYSGRGNLEESQNHSEAPQKDALLSISHAALSLTKHTVDQGIQTGGLDEVVKLKMHAPNPTPFYLARIIDHVLFRVGRSQRLPHVYIILLDKHTRTWSVYKCTVSYSRGMAWLEYKASL